MIRDDEIDILGGGLTGALLGVLLARRGLRPTIWERQPDPRASGPTPDAASAPKPDTLFQSGKPTGTPAGGESGGRSINLALAARGIRALERAALMPRVRPLLMPMPGRMLHQEDGAVEFQPYGQRDDEVNYSISRAGLNRVLLDAAGEAGVELRFGERCVAVDPERRRALLENTATGARTELSLDPLIAADGAGSIVRRALDDVPGFSSSEELLSHGYKELTVPPSADGTHALEPRALHVWPRGGFMLIALPNPPGDFTATLFLPNEGSRGAGRLEKGEGSPGFDRLGTPEAIRAFFERHFPDAAALMPDLVENFLANPTGIMGTVRCRRWHLGGDVLLVGDAAHAIVPFHGQGMNAGFEDCAVLDALIADSATSWPKLFAAFEAERRPNAEAIADLALENYVEMRDTVRDPRFHLKKALAFELERRLPERFVPRYSMVMFHPEIPYAEAQRRGAIQARLLERLTEGAEELADIDLDAATALVRDALPPLPATAR